MSSRNHLHPARPAVDLLTGAFLFFATAAFVLWQDAHLTVLWDISYILENATRISLGQHPYRDFPFPYAPLTFIVQAFIIKLFGRVILHHYLYAAISSGLGTLLTWRILLRLLNPALLNSSLTNAARMSAPQVNNIQFNATQFNEIQFNATRSRAPRLRVRLTAFLLALPLVFLGTNSILPIPFYDSDCTLFILICLWLLLRVEAAHFPPIATFLCGILLAVPPFIKQNTGLAFFLSAAVCILYFGVRTHRRAAALLLTGAATGFIFALALIQFSAGLANYYHWTIQFAASRRLPGFAAMLGVYRDSALLWIFAVFAVGIALLLWRTPAKILKLGHLSRWLAVALLSLPFLSALAALFLQDDASDRVEALLHLWPVLLLASLFFALWQLPRATTIAQLIPLVLLGAIHGAFLSQQLWGSTYALWPLLMILFASILSALASSQFSEITKPRAHESTGHIPHRKSRALTFFTILASSVLLITGGYYASSHERLSYVDLSGDTLVRSQLRPLRGLAMRGNWLPDFDELLAYSEREIPRTDAILMVPGEDLFYFTTGRTPQFPVVMMDNTVNPYSAGQIVQLARERNVRWLIVKRTLQLQEEPISFRPLLLQLLQRDFELSDSLNNYDVYRRKQHSD